MFGNSALLESSATSYDLTSSIISIITAQSIEVEKVGVERLASRTSIQTVMIDWISQASCVHVNPSAPRLSIIHADRLFVDTALKDESIGKLGPSIVIFETSSYLAEGTEAYRSVNCLAFLQ